MSFSKELLDKHAPEAECVQAMKIWKLPDGKENMFPSVCNSGEYFAELKKDGYWYQYEKTEHYDYLFSRNVSKTTGILTEKLANVPHIKKAFAELPVGTILIGEIYYPGKTSKDVTKIMGCLSDEAIIRQQTSGLIHFYLHDVIKYNGVDLQNEGAWVRYQILIKIWNKFNLQQYNYLELAKSVEDDIQEFTAAALNAGEEGVVLKKRDAVYSPDKRPAWSSIKVKKMDFLDCICIGFEDATKQYNGKELNTWEYWIETMSGNLYHGRYLNDAGCVMIKTPMEPVTKPYFYGWKTSIRLGVYDDNNKIIEIGTVSSGLTDELKADFAKHPEKYLNRVVAIQCMEKNKDDHTLRHAFFKGFRDDKDVKDCRLTDLF